MQGKRNTMIKRIVDVRRMHTGWEEVCKLAEYRSLVSVRKRCRHAK